MKSTIRLICAAIVIATIVIAIAASATPSPQSTRPIEKHPSAPAASRAVPADEHSAVALADIRAYAQQHFVVLRERPATFHTFELDAYEMRSLELEVVGGVIRIHHATSRDDPTIRYTIVQDGDGSRRHIWVPAH
jgi:hypothetical protein